MKQEVKIMFKKLFLFSFLLISTFADAETLFYKKDGSPITPQEHEILYKIMLETQFPMSAAYGNYYDDEIKAMNEKIRAQFQKKVWPFAFSRPVEIEATFIPTALYELLAIKFINDNLNNLAQATNHVLSFSRTTNCKNINLNLELDRLYSAIDNFNRINRDTRMVKWHLNINNYILKNIMHKISFPLQFNDVLKILEKFDFMEILSSLCPQSTPIDFYSIFKRAIAIEYQAQNTDKFVLYRGSDFIDDYHDQSLRPNRSISFGASLLGGFLGQFGTCAYCYMTTNTIFGKKLGYVLFIDKKEYMSGILINRPLLKLI